MRADAFKHLFDVTPSVIARWMLGEEPPEDWKKLSLIEGLKWNERPRLRHPISAEPLELKGLGAFLKREDARDILAKLREAELELMEEALEDSNRAREIWNELPERLYRKYLTVLRGVVENPEELAGELVHIPADPAFPDHDWLSRAEIYASIKAIEEGGERVYFLRFKISPVQGFIGNARKELDFWAGSHFLSMLTYTAIEVILEREWPGALVFPHLRGQPFFVRSYGGNVKRDEYTVPNMPNKVLAVVGLKDEREAKGIEEEIRNAIADRIRELFRRAWNYFEMGRLIERVSEGREEPERAFEYYLNLALGYFRITVEVVPYEKLQVMDEWAQEIIEKTHGDREAYYPYLFAVLDQRTDFRHLRFEKPIVEPGFKCTLCGELLSIGSRANGKVVPKRKLRESWNEHVRFLRGGGKTEIRENERLCPLCLIKRYYPRTLSGFGPKHWVSSVSEVALRGTEWERILDASRNGISYGTGKVAELVDVLSEVFRLLGFNSEVVYPESWASVKALAKVYGWEEDYVRGVLSAKFGNPERFVERVRLLLLDVQRGIRSPRSYYAILKMDGDNMGKVISGKRGMLRVNAYLEAEETKDADFKKPVTPPVHQAITRSLSKFAVEKVGKIVKENRGETILAGGDDVLALLPTDKAVKAAFALQNEFRRDWDGFDYLQGKTRSMSGGLLVVHYKEPLYYAYSLVSGLEHLAKESGRNALAIGYLTHSGSYRRVVVNWDVFTDGTVENLLSLMGDEKKLSTRFMYEVMGDIERWPREPSAILELFRSELKRHSNLKNEEFEQTLKAFFGVAGHIRPVEIPEELMEKLRDALVIDPESKPLKSQWPDGLLNVASMKGVPERDVAEVMKEQLRDALLLLKILREMGVSP